MYRTVPVDLSVVVDGDYTEDDDWHAILDRHDTFAVSPCMCRVSTLIREGKAANTQEAMELFGNGMRDCNHPTETCLVTGKQAEWFIEIGAGRELTRDEAEALLQRSVDEGMILDCLYTKEAETADMFIERVTHEIGKDRRVRVATSDGMEQVIILGHGALRVSARMFHQEVQDVEKEIKRYIQGEA